jgi:putative Mg2+ transporter-C (MgtC) family protein
VDDYTWIIRGLKELGPVLAAVACGGLIGLERESRGKAAGLRTAMLICMGSAAYVQASGFIPGEGVDHSRVMGQIITGIGFLGAGAIITNRGQVSGLTTAATIWVTAAIGVALGMGWYARGFAWTLMCVIVLHSVRLWDRPNPAPEQGPDSEQD